ncbi:MAG: shikimate dehydrogenase [Clostridiales Family XIII bacterium]|jgi:shikimate dehydrogenase|nr:shikimate dehydrogenase [Clostridiales Family XIII bacterium]
MRNIVLIGLPGSGKSTLGALAAKRFGLDFLDMDAEIEREAGMSISEIFSKYGEPHFRELETAAARAAARRLRCVIATGGGAVLRAENMRALRENGFVVFLDRPPAQIANGLDAGARPLLAGGTDRIHRLSRERRKRYLAFADARLPCAAGLKDASEGLCRLVRCEYPDAAFAVIGDPIGHSLSPAIHNAVFAALGADCRYSAIRVPKGRLDVFVERARFFDLSGFNVTIPHKQDIIPFLDGLDEEAALCGAVNTVRNEGGRFIGYNTDMEGLLRAVEGRGRAYGGAGVAILGAGGAAAGIAMKAACERARRITIFARRPAQAEELRRRALRAAAARGAPDPEIRTEAMEPRAMCDAVRDADILINATPLGMSGTKSEHASFAFLEYLPVRALVCDLIYEPARTKLLREAATRGFETLGGLDMLIAQALLADEIFLGRALDADALSKLAAGAVADERRSVRASRRASGNAGRRRRIEGEHG